MRALVPFLFVTVAGCDHPSAVIVDDATAIRTPDGHVQVDILVTGAEQAGRTIGGYCVSAHWMGVIDPNLTDPAPTYYGELDQVTQCYSGLGDGDRRTIRITSTHTTDLTPGTAIRCQASVSGSFTHKEIDNP